MGKRKAVVQTESPPLTPKSAKKGKTKAADDVQLLSPKRTKTKAEKRLNASPSVILEEPQLSSPNRRSKSNHDKYIKNDSVADSSTSSPKRNKHKKDKTAKSSPKVKANTQDKEEDEVEVPAVLLAEETDEIDLMDIPKGDLEMLLDGIQKVLPEHDTMAAKARAKKLKWDQIAFNDYSPEQCAKIWHAIQKRQRQYRLMSELLADAKQWLETPWRTSKKNRHPDFPKRPKSAFLMFLGDAKAGIMREHKDLKITDIARIAGQQYRELSEADRQAYCDCAAVEMRKHETEVEAFYKKHPQLKIDTPPKYAGPKRARAPFAIFLEDHLSKEDHVTDKTAYRMACKEAWSNMKAKKKLPWIRQAVAEHRKYVQEVQVYNIEHPNEPVKPSRTVLNKEEVAMLDKAQGKPTKPPTSAYMLYTQQLLRGDTFAGMPSKDRVKAIAAQWSQVGKAEKEDYDRELHQMQEKYNEDYKAYLDRLPEEERTLLELESEQKKQNNAASKERRNTVSKRDVSMQALPKHWSAMTKEEKKVYVVALGRVREHFDTKKDEIVEEENVPEKKTEAAETSRSSGSSDESRDSESSSSSSSDTDSESD